MVYQFLKILVGFTLKIFFQKIYISGTEHVQNNKAQLVASNHPNGFLEPLIMACFFPKDLHFLVRGDVFDNPFLKPLLIATHQIPIFRFRDGFSKLRENSQTMDESTQVLIDKKNLLIFAEGGTQSIKKLRPLQKGIARIAFQTLEKQPDLDLEILPVGINFTEPSKFNKEVMLRVSPPLKVKPYFEKYLHDKNKAMDQLLTDLYNKMVENVVHLEDQDKSHFFENMLEAQRSLAPNEVFPIMNDNTSCIDAEKSIANDVDQCDEEKYFDLKSKEQIVTKKLKASKITWSDLSKLSPTILRWIGLVIGFVPAISGYLMHIIPIAIGRRFTSTKVKQKEFKASILMVSILVLTLIQYIILGIIIVFTKATWVWMVIFIILGLIARFYYTYYSNTVFINKNKFDTIKSDAQNILTELKN